jgi:hypothetical protein
MRSRKREYEGAAVNKTGSAQHRTIARSNSRRFGQAKSARGGWVMSSRDEESESGADGGGVRGGWSVFVVLDEYGVKRQDWTIVVGGGPE